MDEDKNDELSKLLDEAFPEQVIANWIVIAEIITEENKYLNVQTSEDMSMWLASGMLKLAEQIIEEDQYIFELEETEDGE